MTEEPPIGNLDKPAEIKTIIERFCLGRRRLELFGNDRSVKNGWLVVGQDLSRSNFDVSEYNSWFYGESNMEGFRGGRFLGSTKQIETLRPKSPPKNEGG